MPKRNLKNEILKKLHEFNVEEQSLNKSGEEIFTITCNNYMINIIENRVNINFLVTCSPIESAKLINILSKIKNIDIYVGYVYILTKNGRLLVNKRAIEYAEKSKYEDLSDDFIKDYYEKKFLMNHQAGTC